MKNINNTNIIMFEGRKIRKTQINGKLYLSIVDIISILIEQNYEIANRYWEAIKEKLNKEQKELITNRILQATMEAENGQKQTTDVTAPATLYFIIQCYL